MKKVLFKVLLLFASIAQPYYSNAQENHSALKNYLEKPNPEFYVECVQTVQKNKVTQYEFILTSQKWKDYTWKHRLVILAPNKTKYQKGLLYIGGGSLEEETPRIRERDDQLINELAKLASENQTIVSAVFQVPNQPLFDGKVEDQIISYTLHQYQETDDEEWPLLFPMVKSVQKAMDVVTLFTKNQLGHQVDGFLLTGLSKRGWTTWLTAAQDERVIAIAPMVIDVLNMPVSLQYQIEMWQDYSPEIQDYVNLGIPQQSNSEKGKATISMVDPYAYRHQLTVPKLVFVGTNDPYWPVDAAKNYWNDLPGKNNLIYIPNVGHGLGDGTSAFQNLSAFLEFQCREKTLPAPTLELLENTGQSVKLSTKFDVQKPKKIELWEAYSEEDMDFRDERWSKHKIKDPNTSVSLPSKGQKTFYFAYHYTTTNGKSYYITSNMIRCDKYGVIK
ncbi:PhoPQ-activated pathogenicity-related family protein [Echinicola sp. 20G]|uniref:PhoPQ-activated pathogenicity-related family protein n=1 Tax=Echinicola sp. 20G TaxID=2781961 RepID=UPI00191019A9|nr:PhoPQ-activated protein PqaA family protein [Echinicola sp. 20G]